LSKIYEVTLLKTMVYEYKGLVSADYPEEIGDACEDIFDDLGGYDWKYIDGEDKVDDWVEVSRAELKAWEEV
jgi:hypothetical protein